MSVLRGFIYLVLIGVALGDVYMHSPRGSNDRLNEATENRANDQRLFDSQNNDKGGYTINTVVNGATPQGDAPTVPLIMQYASGSILPIEWTNQHSCGNERGTCNMVIQYMCSNSNAAPTNLVRDGVVTDTITADATGPTATTTSPVGNVLKFGMNENYTYWANAKVRSRNKGLFIADQAVGDTAQSTRQNPGGAGNQHGYEIAEERDYYPYWHPNPWKDIAVLTDNMNDCAFYEAESGNVKPKNLCSVPTANNAADCATAKGTWYSVPPPAGLAAPDCVKTDFTRDNHLGNSASGTTPNYTWIVPNADQEPCVNSPGGCACVLRLRYNISTGENNLVQGNFLTAANNTKLKTNPTVNVEGRPLTLAFNTAQTGRTFQDRSFTFNIVPRPAGIDAHAKIYNLNVRGKRGNIVQVYPAVEYDYVPSRLAVNVGDYINPQWVGSDNNPQQNEGEGRDGTDRTNMVQIQDLNHNYPFTSGTPMFGSADLRAKFALLGQNQANCNNNGNQQSVNNCAKLNQAGPYFQGGIIQVNTSGVFNYMGTRNNNFSNRSQKGQLIVNDAAPNSGAIAAIVAGSVAGAGALAGGVIMLL